jgi:hypothetical protein
MHYYCFKALFLLLILAAQTILVPRASAEPLLDFPPQKPRTVVFGSLDVAASGYASVGAKYAPFGSLHEDGFLLMSTLGGGASQNTLSRFDPQNTKLRWSGLVGYQWMLAPDKTQYSTVFSRMQGIFSVFVGSELNYQEKRNNIALIKNTLDQGDVRGGLRVQAEAWLHPTPETLFTTTLTYGTVERDFWGRTSVGYAIPEIIKLFSKQKDKKDTSDSTSNTFFSLLNVEKAFMGTEFTLSHTPDTSTYRFGVHLTNLEIMHTKTFLQIAGGYWMKQEHATPILTKKETKGGYANLSLYREF